MFVLYFFALLPFMILPTALILLFTIQMMALYQRKATLKKTYDKNNARQKSLLMQDSELINTQAVLIKRETELNHTEAMLTVREAELTNTKVALTKRETELNHTKAMLTVREAELRDTKAALTKPEIESSDTVAILAMQESASSSKAYHHFEFMLEMGAWVSKADENIADEEIAMLHRWIHESDSLNELEKASLYDKCNEFLKSPLGVQNVRRKLLSLSQTEKDDILYRIKSIVLADGKIEPREVQLLKWLYPLLRLPADRVESDLKAFKEGMKAIVQSQHDDIQSTSSIENNASVEKNHIVSMRLKPWKDDKDDGFELDDFDDEDEGNMDAEALDQPHQNLLRRLLTQDTWTQTALERVVREHKLMTSGAIEEINDWSYRQGFDELIEIDVDSVSIKRKYLAMIRKELNSDD